MQKNIIDKIWESHVALKKEGYPDTLAIDLHLVHEVTSPQAFDVLRSKGLQVHATSRTLATVDHNVSTSEDRKLLPSTVSRAQIEALRKNCRDFGVPLLDMGSGKQGIVHVISPELGLTQPGMTIVCGDSHTSTHGAFGALAFGIGTSEVAHVLATGCMLQKRPKTMRVEFKGKVKRGITSKDMILKLIQTIGIFGANGHVIEYCGEAVRALTMEQRMTICNMSIECGAKAGLIAPDETTYAYINGRPGAPKGAEWDKAVAYWHSLASDPGSHFDKSIVINVSLLAPMVSWGTNPGQSISIEEKTPNPSDLSGQDGEQVKKAYEYVKLKPGQSMIGMPVDYVFIGSCTNARISDLREAAALFVGKKVAPGVIVFVVPGSEAVRKQAVEEGLDALFTAAGAQFRQPGCSMCLGMNEDKVPPGKRCASTSNRNFIGRQGPGSITHLMSPIMAAAAAITGKITDVRTFI